jgi:hypothetical protein
MLLAIINLDSFISRGITHLNVVSEDEVSEKFPSKGSSALPRGTSRLRKSQWRKTRVHDAQASIAIIPNKESLIVEI